MRRIIFVFISIFLLQYSFAQRTGTMKIRGVECQYDTLKHFIVGPGVTYTQFQFNNINVDGRTYKMRTHLIVIDMKNKNNSFSPYLSKGEFYEVSKQTAEVKRQKEELDLKPIASLNGSGFFNNAYPGQSSYMYEIPGSVISNREVYYEAHNPIFNCWVDGARKAHVGYSEMKGSIETPSGESLPLVQVNHFRNHVDATKYVSLFCNGIPRTQSSENSGTDVIIKKKDGTKFCVGSNACVVESVLDGTWHDLDATQAGLSAAGDMAVKLKNLHAGDEIVINIDYQDGDGNVIDMVQQCTNFIEGCVWHGEAQPFDDKDIARSAIGVSMNGDTCYWADLEISQYSNSPDIFCEDFMVNVGVYDAMWLDGGPSAEMTVWGDFVTNNSIGSGFNGRLIPGGFMLYSVAPDDPEIVKAVLQDPTPRTVSLGAKNIISLYGYNQYDELLTTNAQASQYINMAVTNDLGTISNGIFTATKEGEGYITFNVKSRPTEVTYLPITVTARKSFSVYPKTLFTGEDRKCQATAEYSLNGEKISLDPADVQWTATNPFVVVDCTAGLLSPMMDGFSNVIAQYDGLADTIRVTVENLEDEYESVDFTDQIVTGSKQDIHLTSVPYWFCAKVNATSESLATLSYTANGTACSGSKMVSGTDTMIIVLDYDNLEQYPININAINGASLTGLVAYYTPYTPSTDVTSVNSYAEPFSVMRLAKGISVRNLSSQSHNVEISLYTPDGQTICNRNVKIAVGADIFIPETPSGIIFVTIKTADTIVTKKVF